ncbi:hypothetical protein RB597_003293 [Gaeumannomyces tritici]
MSFTAFPRLPLELRRQIWAMSMPEPQPEVCIVWPLVLARERDGPGRWEKPALPLVVDTAWPAIMHACGEGRRAALESGDLTLRRRSAAAGDDMRVPYRAFDPAIDTLYWGEGQADAMDDWLVHNGYKGYGGGGGVGVGRALRHVAVNVAALEPMGFLGEIVRRTATGLRTLSIVLPNSGGSCGGGGQQQRRHKFRTGFLPPARRCRLRELPPDVCGETSISSGYSESYPDPPPEDLAGFVQYVLDEMSSHVRRARVTGPEGGTAWIAQDEYFGGLAVKVQTFVEYDGGGGGGGGRWEEVCGARMLDRDLGRKTRPPHLEASERGDPTEYRVIEDDCLWELLSPPRDHGDYDRDDPW